MGFFWGGGWRETVSDADKMPDLRCMIMNFR